MYRNCFKRVFYLNYDLMPEIEYYQCPLCGWCKPLKYVKKEVRFDIMNLDNAFIYQIRVGGGRGSGFHIDKEKSLKLKDLNNDIKNQIKKQCKKILKILK